MHTRVYTRTRGNLTYLLEGLQHLLPLAEVPEKQLQGPRHQRGVVVHRQVQQDAEEGSAAVVIQVQGGVLLAKAAQRGGGQMSHKRPPLSHALGPGTPDRSHGQHPSPPRVTLQPCFISDHVAR